MRWLLAWIRAYRAERDAELQRWARERVEILTQPPQRSDLGVARVGEVLLPIVAVRLEAGAVVVQCKKRGPIPADSGPVRFYGADGIPVTETHNDGRITLKQIAGDEVLNMRFALTVGKVAGPYRVDWS